MAKKNAQQGFIGFFDILGYQNYLINNDPIIGANEVIKVLNNIQDEIPNQILENLLSSTTTSVVPVVDRMGFLVFSDTILISLPCSKGKDIPEKLENLVDITVFYTAVFLLVRKLFNYGLPFRGSLNYGNFIIENYCFAGNAIIDGYLVTKKLDVATVVCTDDFIKIINTINKDIRKELSILVNKNTVKEVSKLLSTFKKNFDDLFSNYLIPLKDGNEEKMKTINIYKAIKMSKEDSLNISQFVYDKFWEHKKDIPESVQNKVNNTIQLIRYFKNH